MGDIPDFFPMALFAENSAFLHLFTDVWMCSFQLSLLLMITPRYLTDFEIYIFVHLFGCVLDRYLFSI